jgi:hypothetical protein
MPDENEELELSIVQTGMRVPRKPGRPRLENPKRPRRARKKTEEEIWKENLDTLSEERRSELLALAAERQMCIWLMDDIYQLSRGNGTAGVDRACPDLTFLEVKEHIRKSGGLVEKYPTKEKDMEWNYQQFGLMTKIYAADFKRFAYQVADWCHANPEEPFDKDVQIESTQISGWRAQPQPVRLAKSIQAFDEANTSHQEKDRRQSIEHEKKWLQSIKDAEQR